MDVVKTKSEIHHCSRSELINQDFDPDKRIEVNDRPVNGNFTDEDKAAIERGIGLQGNDDFKDTRKGPQWEDPEKGYLKPNYEYTAGENEYSYKTDSQGRIIHAEALPLKEKPREERIPHNSQ